MLIALAWIMVLCPCFPKELPEFYQRIQRIDDLDRLAELFDGASRQWMRQVTWSRIQEIRMSRGLERPPFPAS